MLSFKNDASKTKIESMLNELQSLVNGVKIDGKETRNVKALEVTFIW